MKLAIRSLAAAFVLALAACSAAAPTDPSADAAAPSLDGSVGTQSDTVARGPNLFGSGN
jgi:hypothetical protein